jgi:hypothetical protein
MNLFQLRKKIEMQTGKTISSARIGADLGLKRQQYWNYEQGKHQPDIFVVRAMTQYFKQWIPDLTIEHMIDIIEETVNPPKKDKRAAA